MLGSQYRQRMQSSEKIYSKIKKNKRCHIGGRLAGFYHIGLSGVEPRISKRIDEYVVQHESEQMI